MMSEPTYTHYANRLIEWVDENSICEVYKEYENLVNLGIDLDHAFNIVTRNRL